MDMGARCASAWGRRGRAFFEGGCVRGAMDSGGDKDIEKVLPGWLAV